MAKILIVDDCRSTLKLMEGVLTFAGHQVSSFEVSSHCLHGAPHHPAPRPSHADHFAAPKIRIPRFAVPRQAAIG